MIAFRNFALRRGERLLLSDVDLALHAGYRVGVVGRNGTGKSSLFAALMGELEPDRGDIDVPGKARIAWVAQETPALPDSALDFVLSGDREVHAAIQAEANAFAAEDWEAVAEAHQRLEAVNGYDASARAGRLLHGLGFAPETHGKPVSDFSGGWRVRLNVARALMTPSDLLLLDEPTNHLDLDAVVWLEEWLRRYPGTLLVISHDREFLDNVTTHTLHLHEGRAKLYTGGYTAFERQRAEHLRQQQIAHEKEQVERAHLQSFIDRFKAKATKAKQAQSRAKMLAKMQPIAALMEDPSLSFDFPSPDEMRPPLITLDLAAVGYDDMPILQRLNLRITPMIADGNDYAIEFIPPVVHLAELDGIVAVHDHMVQLGRGHVVCISSIYGNHAVQGSAVYSATKAAVNVLARQFGAEVIEVIAPAIFFHGAIGLMRVAH